MKSGRGGRRPGAGRPSNFKSRPLIRVLVPLEFWEEIKEFVRKKEEEKIRKNQK